eukprot:TRINITY_DN9309_c0_g1_i1.p1 TRINITY_DN9309_c0_g1~~TRINITY_DN9309_c0_g1_i1.p1  ORF type:complete len:127 (-),score=51.75 TRINITY_DN9309_c0_g1_i1:143-523(-)
MCIRDSYYSAMQRVGDFNQNDPDTISPAIEAAQNPTQVKILRKACSVFEEVPELVTNCVSDHTFSGKAAIKETREDLERKDEAKIVIPSDKSVRDLSRYRTNALWGGTPTWECSSELDAMLSLIHI